MTLLNAPTGLQLDYVVEIVHNNNPQTTSAFHYETFDKALAHYLKAIDGTTDFTIFSLDVTIKRNNVEDFRRHVLAKNK